MVGKTIVERLSALGSLNIPREVWTEFDDKIRMQRFRNKEATLRSLVDKHVIIHEDVVYDRCVHGVHEWYKQMNKNTKFNTKLGEGEKKAAALALLLSRRHGEQVCLLTDDYEARNELFLGQFLGEQQVGWVASTLEGVLYEYQRTGEIELDSLRVAKQDYLRELNADTGSRYDSWMEGLIERSCKKLGYALDFCSAQCLA